MSQPNNIVFKGLHIIAWIIFIGLCIEAGGLIVNFIFSIYNPAFVGHLYQKLDLSQMYLQSKWAFFGMYSFILSIAILKAILFYIVIRLINKLDLTQPFNNYVSQQITLISYYTLTIGLFGHVARQIAKNMEHHGLEVNSLNQFWPDSQAFILMAAIIYVIASIFKRGIEIQSENELTV